MSMLAGAIERLTAFRHSLSDADVIDEATGLSAGDLDCILAELDDPVVAPDPGCME